MDKTYLVVYSKDGTIHLWPANDRQDAIRKATEMYENEKIRNLIKATTIIRRNIDSSKLLFGNPKSLDIMQKGYIK